ncbi:hypothetical protein [Acinetobacter bereziniae]|uniref:hypothetical protein n=1 Tax=Acinetobacter bereziniae TaxID=106648 RepID=UPI00125049FA|nr:hypothetical protein [Acinetobacter bereziniae]
MALTDLDTRVALAVQTPQVDFNQLLNNSLDTYNTVKGMGQQGILSRLLAQNTGADGQVNLAGALQSAQTNPNQAYQSGMVNTLSGLIQQQNAAKLKAQQEAEKQRIDNAKTVAETRDKELGNTQKGQTLLSNLIATSTDATDAAKKLEILGSQYGLPPETIEATKAQLTGLAANNQGGPDAFENMRKSYGLFGTPDPIKYMQPEANTIANNEASIKTTRMNNETSIKTTGMNNDASKYTADSTAKTAANKLEQDKILAEQELAYKEGQIETMQGEDGITYAYYKSGPNAGKIEPFLLSNNQPFKQKPKGAETQIQKTERIEKALGYEDAAKSAATASTLAAKLANDLKGLNSTAGGYGIAAKIPGSPQKKFASQIETLQSQVFLNQIAKMRGLGALTDAEGQRLATSIANLDINLDPTTLQSNLTEIAKIMSGAAVKASKLAKLHANPNGVQQLQSQQNAGSNQSMSTSMTEVRQAAQQMGISVQDAVNMFKAQGVNIQ